MLLLMFLMFTVFNMLICKKAAEELGWAETSCACHQAMAVTEEPAKTRVQPSHLRGGFSAGPWGSRMDLLGGMMEMLVLLRAVQLAGWSPQHCPSMMPPNDITSPITQHGLEPQGPPAAFPVCLPDLR